MLISPPRAVLAVACLLSCQGELALQLTQKQNLKHLSISEMSLDCGFLFNLSLARRLISPRTLQTQEVMYCRLGSFEKGVEEL